MNLKLSAKQLCLTGVMAALVFLMTFIPKVPIPLGYAHLGDGMIFIAAYIIGKKEGMIAAAIGSALADLIGGFPIWILPTFIIKLVMAYIFCELSGDSMVKNVFAMSVAVLFMATGYTVTGAILFDSLEAGLASAPGLLIKGGINIIMATAVIACVKKSYLPLLRAEH
ncbi:MAG: ECF transporter S component [Selenomonadaceae bacterium]|nr:ECF transporter S component [Selenomonadaceae bacterium]